MTTPKQSSFITALLIKAGLSPEQAAEWLVAQDVEGLTTPQASQLIATLQGAGQDDEPEAATPEQAEAQHAANEAADADIVPAGATHLAMGNQYPNKCFGCGTRVEAQAGRRAKYQGRWIVMHLQGACPAAKPAKAAASTGLDLSVLPLTPTGHGSDEAMFAVPNGDTRLKLRVRRVTKAGKWQGWIFVDDGAEYGMQTKYGKQAPGKSYEGAVQEALAAILADPAEALRRYGRLTSHCGVCARPLEDAVSVYNGIGPICSERLGIPRLPVPADAEV